MVSTIHYRGVYYADYLTRTKCTPQSLLELVAREPQARLYLSIPLRFDITPHLPTDVQRDNIQPIKKLLGPTSRRVPLTRTLQATERLNESTP